MNLKKLFQNLCEKNNFEINPNQLDLIICDGPPSTTKGSRSGIIKILNLLSVNGFIIFDDANRKSEKRVIKYIINNFEEYKSFNLDKSTVLLKKTKK